MENKQPYKETLNTLSALAKDSRLTSAEQTALMLAYGYIYYHESLYHKLSEQGKQSKQYIHSTNSNRGDTFPSFLFVPLTLHPLPCVPLHTWSVSTPCKHSPPMVCVYTL